MRRPSPAIVVATVAVVAGLTGTGVAATSGDGVGKLKYVSSSYNADSSGVAGATVRCPKGWAIVGGGHHVGAFDTATHSHVFKGKNGTLWGVIAVNLEVLGTGQVNTAHAQAYAICGKGKPSSTLAASSSESFGAAIREVRAEHAR